MASSKSPNLSDQILLIVFLPVDVSDTQTIFLHGDIETNDDAVNVYGTHICRKNSCMHCIGVYLGKNDRKQDYEICSFRNWIHLENEGDQLKLKKLIVKGELKMTARCSCVVIYYEPQVFVESRNLLSEKGNAKQYLKDHFMILTEKLRCHKKENQTNLSRMLFGRLFVIFTCIVFYLSIASKPMLYFKNYSSIAENIDNYVRRLFWVTDTDKRSERDLIKKLNFVLSVIADVLLGALFLNWLTSQVSSDSFPELFLWTIESIGQSLRALIHWLTGDPAGFKLNYMFSKILATFTIFYIDIWCVFIEFLKPCFKIIFRIFLILGRVGITFQVSVIADLLTIVSFHIYSICVYIARLYDIQIHALVSLWRLFLGRKKNPLKKRVDSCKYSPEQLFIGTLGFTILLFLLPTTLIYYVVFTFMRIIIATTGGILIRIRYFVHTLPVYSTILWLLRSPKLNTGIRLIPISTTGDNNCFTFHVKPVSMSWRDSIPYYKPEFVEELKQFKLLDFLRVILSGKLK